MVVRLSAQAGLKRMEKLGEGEFRKILHAIEILAAGVDYAGFPGRAVAAIAAAIDVDFISYNEVDSASGTNRFFLKPDPAELEPGSFEYAAFIRRFGNHPMIAQKVVAGGADPRLQQFVSRLRLLGMVGNCCGQAELRLNLGLTLSSTNGHRVGVAVHRSVRDFDDRDAASLEALRPHIVAAFKNALRSRGPGDTAQRDIRVEPPGSSSLTRRENEVLYWVSMGKTNDEVSRIIGAKPLTVKKHLEHIYDKLGVPNRTAAARFTSIPPISAVGG